MKLVTLFYEASLATVSRHTVPSKNINARGKKMIINKMYKHQQSDLTSRRYFQELERTFNHCAQWITNLEQKISHNTKLLAQGQENE